VATPLEQQLMASRICSTWAAQSTGDGKLTITVTFRIGTDLNVAQMLTQNRVQDLCRGCRKTCSVLVCKSESDTNILLAIHVYSPDSSRDNLYLSNYTTCTSRTFSRRLEGVGDVQFQGGASNPHAHLADRQGCGNNLNGSEVLVALRARTCRSRWILNQPPAPAEAYQINVGALAAFPTRQFGDIVVKIG